jgi:hypothetical protein
MNSPTMDDIHRLAEIYQIKPSAFFEEDGPTRDETDPVCFADGSVLANISIADRQRIVGYLRECAEVLVVLPEGFTIHWAECLKIAAATLDNQRVGRAPRRGRGK